MLGRKMWRDFKNNMGQFVSIFLMALLGVMVFAGIHAQWYGMEREAERFYRESRLADLWLFGMDFTDRDRELALGVEGVEAVSRRLLFDGGADLPGDPVIRFNIVEDNVLSQPLVREGEELASCGQGFWLDENFARSHGLEVGDWLLIKGMGLEMEEKIAGLIMHPEYIFSSKDETEFVPNHHSFGFAVIERDYLPAFLPIVYNQLLIEIRAGFDPEVVKSKLEEVLAGRFEFLITREEQSSYAVFQDEIEQQQAVGSVFPIIFFMIAVLAMLTTMTRLVSNQRTQIGILKALGFGKRKIMVHYISYGFWLGLLGGVVGLLLGPLVLSPFFFRMQKALYSLPDWRAALAPITNLGVALAVMSCGLASYFACRRELAEVPAMSLRPRPPKAVRSGFLQKGAFWQRLGFSRQWNLRDIFRSKLRSLMAALGVAGCMALLVCAFGLRDSVNGISHWLYNDLHTYERKISLEESAGIEQIEILRADYDGQLIQESRLRFRTKGQEGYCTLTVLGPGDMIKFEDRWRKPIALPREGAALSWKLADSLGLALGDEVEWNLIGQEAWHRVEIGAINRTPFGQGLTMASDVFESLGPEFRATAILVPQGSGAIRESAAIAGIKSKVQLMDAFNSMLDGIQMIVAVMILGAIILGLVVLANLGALSFSERIREIATLKVIGFFPSQIRMLLGEQNLWLTLVGIMAGWPLGLAAIDFTLATTPDSIDLLTEVRPATLLLCVAITFLVSIGINSLLAGKIKTVDLVTSLKAVE